MPDWNRYSNYNSETITYTWHSVTLPTAAQVRQQYEEYVIERERQERMMEQMLREEAERVCEEQEHIEEMWKYPLFFWRETCKEKK